MIGGPLFMAIGLAALGIWIILLALPGLRRPPPDARADSARVAMRKMKKKENNVKSAERRLSHEY